MCRLQNYTDLLIKYLSSLVTEPLYSFYPPHITQRERERDSCYNQPYKEDKASRYNARLFLYLHTLNTYKSQNTEGEAGKAKGRKNKTFPLHKIRKESNNAKKSLYFLAANRFSIQFWTPGTIRVVMIWGQSCSARRRNLYNVPLAHLFTKDSSWVCFKCCLRCRPVVNVTRARIFHCGKVTASSPFRQNPAQPQQGSWRCYNTADKICRPMMGQLEFLNIQPFDRRQCKTCISTSINLPWEGLHQ